MVRKNRRKETRKDRFTAEKSKESLDRKSPVALRVGDRRENRTEFFVESRVRGREILLLEERKKGRKEPKGEALGLYELSYSSIQGQSFGRRERK